MRTRLFPSLCLGALLVPLMIPNSEGQIVFSTGGGSITRRPLPPQSSQTKGVSGCNCLPQRQCQRGFGQLGTGCFPEQSGTGICCIPQEGVVLTRLGPDPSDVQPTNIPSNVIDTGFQMGRSFFNKMREQDQQRKRSGDYLQRGDPARGHTYFFQRTNSLREIHKIAYILARSSKEVANMQSLTPAQSFFGLPSSRIGPTQTGFQCPSNNVPRCDANSKYRTIDGSCNNLRNPLLGKSETRFSRLKPALYDDGIMEARINGADGKPLPNVRDASNTVLLDVNLPDAEHTLGVMQWAQFIDHDITLAPFEDMEGEGIRCCENGRLASPMPVQCFTIVVPPGDGFYTPNRQQCINFVKSMLAPSNNCALGPVEQVNAVTHWIDGSMIYGSTEEGKESVVDQRTGFMRVSNNNLPPVNQSIDCEARNPRSSCFAGGDTRINEQPALTTVHTLWVREHNRIANNLRQLNPRWNPTKLFEETRRIVIAEVQHITYKEWLPIIIGRSLANRLGVNTLESGYRRSYNPSIDAQIANEFATAAFRFGHSMVQGLFRLLSSTKRQSTVRLRDSFNSPGLLQRNPELLDGFVNSLTLQNIQTTDSLITTDLSNHLFQTPSFNFGMDLMSLNLQRGREHAIATYNDIRQLAGFRRASNFLDLQETTSPDLIRRLQTVYRNADDIDLFIGGMTERSLPDAVLGPTFANVVGKQFQASMNGDRFFYDMGGQAGSFTPEQLQEIRKSSMARIYCDSSNVGEMQPQAFRSVSRSNSRVPCNNNAIPSLNLRVFN